jgi:hypothetical protein
VSAPELSGFGGVCACGGSKGADWWRAMSDLAGRSIGPCRLVERIGRGGMAAVYKAVDTRDDRVLAVKILTVAAVAEPEPEGAISLPRAAACPAPLAVRSTRHSAPPQRLLSRAGWGMCLAGVTGR